jgi:hypothetical protein
MKYDKQRYAIVTLPDVEWTYSYSAKEYEKDLNKMLKGQNIKAIYVYLYGYLEAFSNHRNYIDMSYLGGTVLVVCDKTVLQLAIHVEGMIEYRSFPIWEMRLREVYDYVPAEMAMAHRCFFNAKDHDISFDYTDKEIKGVIVKGTDMWPIWLKNFNEEKGNEAEKKNDLPAEIVLYTESCTIRFLGDEMEYYVVIFEAVG